MHYSVALFSVVRQSESAIPIQKSATFLASGTHFVEDSFSTIGGEGDGFRMIQVCYFYCELYFYFYYISSTSDHQALDPRGWGPSIYMSTLFLDFLPIKVTAECHIEFLVLCGRFSRSFSFKK